MPDIGCNADALANVTIQYYATDSSAVSHIRAHTTTQEQQEISNLPLDMGARRL